MVTDSYSIYHIQTLIHLPFNSYRRLNVKPFLQALWPPSLPHEHIISFSRQEPGPNKRTAFLRSICSETVCDSIYILFIHCTQHLNIVSVAYSVSLWADVLSYHATFINLMFTVWYNSTCGDGIRLDCRTSS